MNQDFTFEDAFKMENLMESLKEREDRYIVKRISSKRGPIRDHLNEVLVPDKSTDDAPAIIGIREHVFTGSIAMERGSRIAGSLCSASRGVCLWWMEKRRSDHQALRIRLGRDQGWLSVFYSSTVALKDSKAQRKGWSIMKFHRRLLDTVLTVALLF